MSRDPQGPETALGVALRPGWAAPLPPCMAPSPLSGAPGLAVPGRACVHKNFQNIHSRTQSGSPAHVRMSAVGLGTGRRQPHIGPRPRTAASPPPRSHMGAVCLEKEMDDMHPPKAPVLPPPSPSPKPALSARLGQLFLSRQQSLFQSVIPFHFWSSESDIYILIFSEGAPCRQEQVSASWPHIMRGR